MAFGGGANEADHASFGIRAESWNLDVMDFAGIAKLERA